MIIPPEPSMEWFFSVLQQHPTFPSNKRILDQALFELELQGLARYLSRKFNRSGHSIEKFKQIIKEELLGKYES